MSAIDILREALFGNPPRPNWEPSREGVLAAFTDLSAAVAAIELEGGDPTEAKALIQQAIDDTNAAREATAEDRGLAQQAAEDAQANASLAVDTRNQQSEIITQPSGPAYTLGDRQIELYALYLYHTPIAQAGVIDEVELFETENAGTFAIGIGPVVNGVWTYRDSATAQSGGTRALAIRALSKQLSPRAGELWGVIGNNKVGQRVNGTGLWTEGPGSPTLSFPATLTLSNPGNNIEPQIRLLVKSGNLVVTAASYLQLRADVDAILAGGGGGSGTVPFDYYVDSRDGNDANAGLTPQTAFRTKTRMMQVLAGQTNKRIGFRRGSVWDHTDNGINLQNVGISIGAYGSTEDRKPVSLGAYPVTSFTALANGRYSVPLAYDPATLTLVSPEGMAQSRFDNSTCVKLIWQGSTGTTPIAGEFAWNGSNTVTFTPGFDLTGWTLMVPVGNSAGVQTHGIRLRGDNAAMKDIDWLFFADFGFSIEGQAGAEVQGCEASYTGGDGADANANSGMVVLDCDFHWNGRRWGAGGGPGDGISCHINSNDPASASSGSIIGCRFSNNTQAGLGNQQGTTLLCLFNRLENNNVNINHYGTGSDFGVQTMAYNLSIQSRLLFAPAGGAPRYGPHINVQLGSAAGPVVEFHNNTFVDLPGVDREWTAITFEGTGGAIEWTNNIAFIRGDVVLIQVAGSTVVSRYNIHFNASGDPPYNSSFLLQDSQNDLTTDPMFLGPLAGDFGLRPNSPARGSGVDLDYDRDYEGNPVPAMPNRGAFQ